MVEVFLPAVQKLVAKGEKTRKCFFKKFTFLQMIFGSVECNAVLTNVPQIYRLNLKVLLLILGESLQV